MCQTELAKRGLLPYSPFIVEGGCGLSPFPFFSCVFVVLPGRHRSGGLFLLTHSPSLSFFFVALFKARIRGNLSDMSTEEEVLGP